MFSAVAILVLFIAKRVSLKRKKIPEVLLAGEGMAAEREVVPGHSGNGSMAWDGLPGTLVSAQMSPARPLEQGVRW